MKHNFKRFLSLLLAMAMVIGMFPMTHAHAEETMNVLSKPVTEVEADAEYVIFYSGTNRGVHGSVNSRNGFTGLDSGSGLSYTGIPDSGYIWTLKAVDGGGYRIYNANAGKYVKITQNTGALVDDTDASIFDFTYHPDAEAISIKAQNVEYGYFNNLGGKNLIGGWNDAGTKFNVRKVLRDHTHNAVDVPAVEPTLNSTGLTAGVECADCGAVISGRETVAKKDYNDGIVPVINITATAGNYNPNHANDGGPSYALDSNLDTRWHTNYSGNSAYGENNAENRWIDFAIDGAYDVTALRYMGRNGNGNITKYKILVSYDGTSYDELTSGDWANNADWKEVVFDKPLELVKNVRLLAVESNAGHAVATEMRLVGTVHQIAGHVHTEMTLEAVAPTIGTEGKTEGKKCSECGEILVAQEVVPALYKSKAVPNSAFTATVGSYETSSATEGNANLALDDSFGTMWHTAWAGTDAENLWFDFELTADYEVTGLYYKPRTGAHNGTITRYQVLGSYDGESWFELTSGRWDDENGAVNDSWKEATFNAAKVKHVRLMAVEFTCDQNKNVASAAEIRLVGVPCDDHFHRYTATVTDPTCTEDGYTTYTCSCGYSYTSNEVAAKGHTFDNNCTTDDKCANCDVVADAAEDHSWPEEGVRTEPEGETAGYTTYTCTNEGCEQTKVVYDATEPELPDFTSEKLTGLTGEASSNDANDGSNIEEAFDGIIGTTGNYWASVKNDNGIEGNEWLIANLNGEYLINKVEYSKRYHDNQPNDGYNCTGNLLDYIIEVRVGNGEWQRVDAGATESQGTTVITFAPIRATQVRLTATQSYHWQDGTNNQPDNRNKVMAVAEFAVYKAVCVEHDYDDGHEFAPTCGTDGYTLYTCGTCGSTKTEAGDSATGNHNWNEGEVTTAATCTKDGEMTYTCTVCGATSTETIDATGHVNTSLIGAKEATCGADGYTGDTVCACGEMVAKGEAIPATGNHTPGEPVMENETAAGYDLVTKCSVCFTELERKLMADKVVMLGKEVRLESEIQMQYRVYIPEFLFNSGAYVVMAKTGAYGEVTKTYTVSELNVGENLVTMGVAPAEITAPISITVYNGDNVAQDLYSRSGEKLDDASRTVAGYAVELLKDDDSTSELKDLAVKLLTYGGYAQQYFGVDAENPAFNMLPEGYEVPDLSNITAETLKDYKNTQTKANMGVKATTIATYVDSNIRIRVYLAVEEGDINDYTFTLKTRTEEKPINVGYDQASKRYYVDITEIASAYIDFEYQITISNGTDTNVITASVLAYARSVLSKSNDEKLLNLAKALYLYNQAANAYYGV